MAELLAKRGDVDGLRARADEGDADAARELADVLAGRGDLDGLRAQTDAGDEIAARRLIDLLSKQGRGEEAALLRQQGLNPDGSIASKWKNILVKFLETNPDGVGDDPRQTLAGPGSSGFRVRDAPGISWCQEVRDVTSDSEAHVPASRAATLERSREDLLDAARPLPPDDDVVIEDLSDEEDRLFLAAILHG